jgi:hypothetical protein
VFFAQSVKLRLIDGKCLRLLERSHRRRAGPIGNERHLAKAIAEPTSSDGNGVPERRDDSDCEPALLDQMK